MCKTHKDRGCQTLIYWSKPASIIISQVSLSFPCFDKRWWPCCNRRCGFLDFKGLFNVFLFLAQWLWWDVVQQQVVCVTVGIVLVYKNNIKSKKMDIQNGYQVWWKDNRADILKEYYEIVGDSRPLSAFLPTHVDFFTEIHF